jgi:lipoate-protein ligase A
MLIVERPQTDPYFNIAAEEYLLKSMDKDCFMLWQNESSIIIGKHQNTLAEINQKFVAENNLPVIRRISGGGTVFHDMGNLNFTFIQKGDKEKLVDFRRFTQPIIDTLNQLGVPARFEGKNDIRVNGLKISGNAEHVYKNKVLHHGTLLYSSQLANLSEALKSNPGKFTDKAVQSVRSRVANIIDFLPEKLTLEEFKATVTRSISKKFPGAGIYKLSDHDHLSITQLAEEKYKTWVWNFGYSPDFKFNNNKAINNQLYNISLWVQKGKITDLQLNIEPENKEIVEFLRNMLIGELYNYSYIINKLEKYKVRLNSFNVSVENVITIIF